MARTVVIRNPVSGRGRLVSRWPKLEKRIERAVGEVVFWDTKSSGDAASLARKALEEDFNFVIAAGGDGTISQVASALIHSTATLGIIPGGTGNDLSRTLGVGPSLDLAFKALQHSQTRKIDAAYWKIEDRRGYFVNVAGMGFDAAVAKRINEGYRMLRGAPAYIAATLGALRQYQAQNLEIVIDDKVEEGRILLCAVANARTYGGGMQIAPTAEIDDGMLDIVLVRDLKKWDFVKAFPRVLKGAHLSHPAVSHFRGRRIVLEADAPSPFLIDGELLMSKRVEIGVIPQALQVRSHKTKPLP